jgi:Pectate lyase superfamily protein
LHNRDLIRHICTYPIIPLNLKLRAYSPRTLYKSAIKNRNNIVPGSNISEFISDKTYSLFPSYQSSLNLEVKEIPIFSEEPLKNWVSVTDFGANGEDNKDDTQAIQSAIDSGKSTVYFPNGNYYISHTIHVRKNVKRIIGFESHLKIIQPLVNQEKSVFRFENGSQAIVALERFSGDYSGNKFFWIEHASSKTLVLRNIYMGSGKVYRNTVPGNLFIEDITGYGSLVFNYQNVWARQLNVEAPTTQIKNNGGTVWILGLKTENKGTVVKTTGGGKTEILGGLIYPSSQKISQDHPAFINDKSHLSVMTRTSFYQGGRYETVVRETRGRITRNLMYTDLPKVGDRTIVPLYIGHEKGNSTKKIIQGAK